MNTPGKHLSHAAGKPGVAKKLTCWRCGGDLLFNGERLLRGRLRLHLYCPRCGLPRVTDFHLRREDVQALAGDGA